MRPTRTKSSSFSLPDFAEPPVETTPFAAPQSRQSTSAALVIFARAPVPGRAKTRLIPLLGEAGAAQFQCALLGDSLGKVRPFHTGTALYLFLAGSTSGLGGLVKIPTQVEVALQKGSTLGDRLESAFRKLFKHHQRAVITGTDSPLLPPATLRLALHELRTCDTVLGPCPDGGYYLIGLRASRSQPILRGLLREVRWSTRFAFRDTLGSITRRGLSCSVLPEWNDVDRPADVLRLRRWLHRHATARRLAPQTWRFLKTFL